MTRYHVDGTAEDGTYQGDGTKAPFAIHDCQERTPVLTGIATREEADRLCADLNEDIRP